jgi:NADPH-dependent 2,4-dienoyl-CoA reductase/sulfur reductase-like enzyme
LSSPLRRVVVVGASLAGLRAAETLRHNGYDGTLTIVGAERHMPYDRPPLSKQVLAGAWEPDRTTLPVLDGNDLDAEWRLACTATALDLHGREVVVDGGERIPFDGVVLATGATPRTLSGTAHLEGVHTLRTLDDALAVRAALDASPERIVVVGAGFIGAEVAATARTRGVEVTLVEALPVPLGRVLGDEMGMVCADLHRDHGVDLRLGVGVDGFEGSGRVEQVVLADGSSVRADIVVVGVGVAPNTAWLDDSGLTLADGVVCDETMLAAPGVVAAGDVARWRNELFDEVMRVEHWDNAVAQGYAAALRLLAGDGPGEPFIPVPWFWSDQYDRKIQVSGRPSPHDEVRVVDGSIEERKFAALYRKGNRLVAVLGFNRPRLVMQYSRLIANRATWDEALTAAAST